MGSAVIENLFSMSAFNNSLFCCVHPKRSSVFKVRDILNVMLAFLSLVQSQLDFNQELFWLIKGD